MYFPCRPEEVPGWRRCRPRVAPVWSASMRAGACMGRTLGNGYGGSAGPGRRERGAQALPTQALCQREGGFVKVTFYIFYLVSDYKRQ